MRIRIQHFSLRIMVNNSDLGRKKNFKLLFSSILIKNFSVDYKKTNFIFFYYFFGEERQITSDPCGSGSTTLWKSKSSLKSVQCCRRVRWSGTCGETSRCMTRPTRSPDSQAADRSPFYHEYFQCPTSGSKIICAGSFHFSPKTWTFLLKFLGRSNSS